MTAALRRPTGGAKFIINDGSKEINKGEFGEFFRKENQNRVKGSEGSGKELGKGELFSSAGPTPGVARS